MSLANKVVLEQALSQQANQLIKISCPIKGERLRWVAMACENAEHALATHLVNKANLLQQFEALQEVFALDALPQRVECFDISHHYGDQTVASCIVFDANGPLKSDYRKFNIKDITPGDDYAAMQQVLVRRYNRVKKGLAKVPDLLIVDGGKGQVAQAVKVLQDLQIVGIQVLGVAKGEGRKPGLETIYIAGQNKKCKLAPSSIALHLIQNIRDEAHRFAINAHRNRLLKKTKSSSLESIRGLGPKKRQLLLKQFGGLREIARVGIDDLVSVHGINKKLAQKIYTLFH